MFSIDCPTHGTEVLLTERRILSLTATPTGHEVRYRCWCGTEGTLVVERATEALAGRHRPAV